jgi:BNR/Asp-box repeat
MLEVGSRSKEVVVWFGLLGLSLLVLLPSTACAGEWKPHEVRRINGTAGEVRLPAELQIVTESWNRVVAVPYLAYIPEKHRLLMLVSCDYPHHPEVLFSDDHGASWSPPKPAIIGAEGKPLAGLGTSLCYLGEGSVLFYSSSRWFSRDYGQTWKESVPLEPVSDGKPWYTWDAPLIERDAMTGKVSRLVETGYTWFKPPEVEMARQQAYLRLSTDGGRTWSRSSKVPQWAAVSEVALLRAANGHLVAACRTDTPARMQPEIIDHTEGLGLSISADDGRTWSEVRKLYDWGRHHPSLVLLPSGEIVMTYVVRKGYVNRPEGFPQFGIEAVVSRDHGETWDLDHKYILHHWIGHIKEGPTAWYPSSQATSTIRLPDGSLLTAFGTGYRCQEKAKGQPAPRDVGLVKWRLASGVGNAETRLRDAPFDSDLRNMYDPGLH